MFIMFTAFLCYICNLFVTIHIPLLGSLRNKNLKLETCLFGKDYVFIRRYINDFYLK